MSIRWQTRVGPVSTPSTQATAPCVAAAALNPGRHVYEHWAPDCRVAPTAGQSVWLNGTLKIRRVHVAVV
jgi:hypothetical protein